MLPLYHVIILTTKEKNTFGLPSEVYDFCRNLVAGTYVIYAELTIESFEYVYQSGACPACLS